MVEVPYPTSRTCLRERFTMGTLKRHEAMSKPEFHHVPVNEMSPLALMVSLGVARDVITVLLSTAPKSTLEAVKSTVECDLASIQSGNDIRRTIVASLEGVDEALTEMRREIVHHLERRF